MVFKRFVQIGRVALVNYGEDTGKLCVIVNVLDLKRVLIDGPREVTGVSRQKIPLKRLKLTDFVIKVPVGARPSTLAKALKADDILNKFQTSSEGKKLTMKKARTNITDFERFKLMVARKTKARAIRAQLAKTKA